MSSTGTKKGGRKKKRTTFNFHQTAAPSTQSTESSRKKTTEVERLLEKDFLGGRPRKKNSGKKEETGSQKKASCDNTNELVGKLDNQKQKLESADLGNVIVDIASLKTNIEGNLRCKICVEEEKQNELEDSYDFF